MNSIKYTYSICFCMFALIFFITSPRIFADEHTKKHFIIITGHSFTKLDLPIFKQLYLTELTNKNIIKGIWPVGHFKLLNTYNTFQLSQIKPYKETFKYSFFNIDNINISDLNHTIVENDKNLPFSDSRNFNKADHNHIILLKKA